MLASYYSTTLEIIELFVSQIFVKNKSQAWVIDLYTCSIETENT